MGVNRLLFPKRRRHFFSSKEEFASRLEGSWEAHILLLRQTSQNDKQVPQISDSQHEYANRIGPIS